MLALLPLLTSGLLAACGGAQTHRPVHLQIVFPARHYAIPGGIHKIRHIVIIMQENRSFDNYFGTYPGADGIPGLAGNPGHVPCVPDPRTRTCVRPFHDRQDVNVGGPHVQPNAQADIDHGKMDGFIREQLAALLQCPKSHAAFCTTALGQFAVGRKALREKPDVMGYHTGADIPNYWTYARDFVLQDHMFESVDSYSLPAHLYLVSAWSASCEHGTDSMSCHNNPEGPRHFPNLARSPWPGPPIYAWTDLTYLLHKHHVSWGYYILSGDEPDCETDMALACAPIPVGAHTGGIWNPLPYFADVRADHQLKNVRSLSAFLAAARTGSLPAVSWITPNSLVSEHPPALITPGQTYVTGLINAVMRSPDWHSTAIFLAWDDWGGFYDNVVPPKVDQNGYGLRVPGLVISPYAKRGFIDHQTLSFDAYLKFIEDDFLGGQRIDPRTDGRPDPRPDVREDAPELGNLVRDFNFNQRLRPPVILPVIPATDLIAPPPVR